MKSERLLFSFLFLISFVFAGCSTKPVINSSFPQKMKILSTTEMINDIVKKVGGDRIETAVLIVGEIDPHSYELVKGDDEKIDGAKLVFFNGLNLEHGASLRYKLSTHKGSIALGDYLLKNYPNEILFEQNQPDPHVWMDMSLWSYTVSPILEGLIAVDPEGQDYYQERAKRTFEEMIKAHEKIREDLQSIPDHRRYLVTSHDAFAYFTRVYLATEEERLLGTWRKRVDAPEGFAPEGQLGAADLQKIVDYLVKYQVEVVFPESNVSQDSLRKIVSACREKGLKVRLSSQALYGDSMGRSQLTKDSGYLGMMDYNKTVLMQQWR